MLAVTYDLDPIGSFLTTSAAAEIFWAIFVVGLGVAALLLGRNPRRRKRTWTYDLPPPLEPRSPRAERYGSSSATTSSTISPENPR